MNTPGVGDTRGGAWVKKQNAMRDETIYMMEFSRGLMAISRNLYVLIEAERSLCDA